MLGTPNMRCILLTYFKWIMQCCYTQAWCCEWISRLIPFRTEILYCQLKTIVTTWKETFILSGGKVEDSKPRRQHLSSSEKSVPLGTWQWESGCIQIYCKGNRQSEHQRSDIKLRNLALDIWEDSSLWAHWIHCFHMYLSYLGQILSPCSP